MEVDYDWGCLFQKIGNIRFVMFLVVEMMYESFKSLNAKILKIER